MLGSEINHGLTNLAQLCANERYSVVCTLIEPASFVGSGLSVVNVTGDFTLINQTPSSIELELNNPVLNEYMDLNFMFNLGECPYNEPDFPGFGPIRFNVQVKKICDDCPSCFKIIACNNDNIQAHCTGECTSPVGTNFGAQFERTTFGWASKEDFPTTPLQDRSQLSGLILDNGGDEQDFQDELHKLYPKDIFTIRASGNAYALGSMYNELGFQIAYTTQAGQAFTFAGGQISAEYVLPTGSIYEGEITTIPLNLSYSIPLTEDDFETLLIGIMGLQGPVYKLNLKNNLDIAQNYPNLINCPSVLSVVASFVATPVNDLGVFENSIKGQFYLDNTVNSSAATFAGSCDAYGEYITFVVPGTSFNLIPTNLPPYINTNEHNYLTNLSGGGINGGFQQNLAHNFTDLNFCKSSFLMGARVFGGYGQYQDDFPFEYRPLISWPSPITLSSINQQPDLPTFNQAEEINSLVDINYIFDPATSILSNDLPNAQLLQPLDKSPLPNPFYNGLALQLNRTCANGSPQYYQSTDFKVNRNAYVHWGQNDFINIDILSDINTLNFNTVFTSADNQSFTTTNYDLSFSLTPFNADLTNFYFYFELTNSAGNIVPNAQINQIPALNNYHISNSISNHLYFFPSLNDFITSVTN